MVIKDPKIVYRILSGVYSNQLIKIDYIAPAKQIFIKEKRYRQAHGILIDSNVKINTYLENLEVVE